MQRPHREHWELYLSEIGWPIQVLWIAANVSTTEVSSRTFLVAIAACKAVPFQVLIDAILVELGNSLLAQDWPHFWRACSFAYKEPASVVVEVGLLQDRCISWVGADEVKHRIYL